MNNDGKKEIIYASDLRKNKTTLFVKNSNFEIIGQEEISAIINTTACFDIDNDGEDEIILGSNIGKLYIYKYKENDEKKFILLTKNKFHSHSNYEIRDIIALNSKKYDRNLILVGSTDGTFGIYYFNEKKDLKSVFKNKLKFSIWSILPIHINNTIKIILGGEGIIALYDFESLLTEHHEFSNFLIEDYDIQGVPKEERIYDIAIIKEYSEFSRIICATRSGKPLVFEVSQNEIRLPNGFPNKIKDWEGSSSYSIVLVDIDNDNEKEIIIVGKTEFGKGCIEIYKFDDKIYWPIKEKVECKYEIYSIELYLKENKIFILISTLHYPLIILEPEFILEPGESKRLKWTIKTIGKDIVRSPRKYVFFTGAGFSYPTFKLADGVKNDIMIESDVNKEELEEFLKLIENNSKGNEDYINFFNNKELIERLPLEFLLFYIKKHQTDGAMKEKIFRYFNKKIDTIPKGVKILAEIIKNNHINTVFTVNYDLLLETELEGIEINKIIRDEDYKSTKICGNKAIIKLHGCITDINTTAAALDEVIKLKKNKEKSIDFIFNGHIIIFIGYSCMDIDIFPALKRIIEENKTICYFVNPASPNKNVKEFLGGDIHSRYLQFTSDDFFEILKENIEIKEEVI